MQTERLTFLILMSLAGHTLAVNEKPFEPGMVAIKAGQFSTGSNSWKSTSPQHTVSIKAFKMAKYGAYGSATNACKFGSLTHYSCWHLRPSAQRGQPLYLYRSISIEQ